MLDQIYGRPSTTYKRIQTILIAATGITLLRRYHGSPPPLRILARLNKLLVGLDPWQVVLATLTAIYTLTKLTLLVGLNSAEPYKETYSRSFYRATWILTSMDAAFWTCLPVKPAFLRKTLSIVFTLYYLVFHDQAESKVRRMIGYPTVESLRVAWQKIQHPVLWVSNILTMPRLTTYRHELHFHHSNGLPPTRACLYYNGADMTLADKIVFFIPGGGFVTMNPECHENYVTKWAKKYPGILIVSFDYKKAPEFPFPHALDELTSCYMQVSRTNGQILGLQKSVVKRKIAMVGDSAGGNLVSAVVIKLIEMQDQPSFQVDMPCALLLVYPLLNFDLACWLPPSQLGLIRSESVLASNSLVDVSHHPGVASPPRVRAQMRSNTTGGRLSAAATPPDTPAVTPVRRHSFVASPEQDSRGINLTASGNPPTNTKSILARVSASLKGFRTQVPNTVFTEYGFSGIAQTFAFRELNETKHPPKHIRRIGSASRFNASGSTDKGQSGPPTPSMPKASKSLLSMSKHAKIKAQEHTALPSRSISKQPQPLPLTCKEDCNIKRTPETSNLALTSRMSFFNDRILNPELLRALALLYVGHSPCKISIQDNFYLSPVLAPDWILERFPKTYFLCGERDPFVDDTVIMAGRLREAKKRARPRRMEEVETGNVLFSYGDEDDQDDPEELANVVILEGISHGFLNMTSMLPEAHQAIDLIVDWFKEMFESDDWSGSEQPIGTMTSSSSDIDDTRPKVRVEAALTDSREGTQTSRSPTEMDPTTMFTSSLGNLDKRERGHWYSKSHDASALGRLLSEGRRVQESQSLSALHLEEDSDVLGTSTVSSSMNSAPAARATRHLSSATESLQKQRIKEATLVGRRNVQMLSNLMPSVKGAGATTGVSTSNAEGSSTTPKRHHRSTSNGSSGSQR